MGKLIASRFKTEAMNHETKEEHHLFIQNLQRYNNCFDDLFVYSKHLNIAILASTENLSYLIENNESTLINICNYIFFNITQSSKQYLEDLGFSNEEINRMYFNSFGEAFAYINDNEVVKKNKINLLKNSLSVEEKDFITKRIKRYRKRGEL